MRTKKLEGSGSSFVTNNFNSISILIVVLLLVIAGIVISGYIYSDLSAYQTLREGVTESDVEIRLADMQSHTLAITALCVTIASIIISVLSLFRENRLMASQQKLEESQRHVLQLEDTMRTLLNVTAVYYLSSDEKDYYFDIVQNYLNGEDKSEQNRVFRLALLNMSAQICERNSDYDELLLFYDKTISEAEEIVSNSKYLTTDIQFAYMELLTAYYQRAKQKVKRNPNGSKEDLQEALNFLEKYSLINSEDTFGNINHMFGLLKLWRVLSDPPQEIAQNNYSMRMLDESIEHFSRAINKSANKGVFYNDRSVAYLKKYDVKKDNDYEKKAHDDLEKALHLADSKHADLNWGSYYIKLIQHHLNLVDLPFSLNYLLDHKAEAYDFEKMHDCVKEAEKHFKAAIEKDATFPNNFYKMAELRIYQILILKLQYSCDSDELENIKATIDAYCKEIETHLAKADSIHKNLLGTLYCRRNYYELIDIEKAFRINEIIKANNPENAEKWEALAKAAL